MYPGLPLVRKRPSVTNRTRRRLRLESVEVERFEMEEYHSGTAGWIYSDYGRRKSLAPFLGTRQDSLMALHNPDWQKGIVLGNEAPDVLKYLAAFRDNRALVAGLTPVGQPYAFRHHLAPGRTWDSPQVFSIVYARPPSFDTILNSVIPDFVRHHLGSERPIQDRSHQYLRIQITADVYICMFYRLPALPHSGSRRSLYDDDMVVRSQRSAG